MTMHKNVWLGDNELVMFYRDGRFHVIEKYNYYEEVFSGTYEACAEYMNRREREYLGEKDT